MTYARKVKIVSYLLPLIIVAFFAKVGTNATHSLFAQTPPTDQIALTLPQSQYKVGQDVIATLANSSATDVYVVNNCPNEPLTVYRQENNTWVAIFESANSSKCVGEPSDYKIPAEHSVRVDYKYWPTLFSKPGTYRIHANIEPSSQGPTIDFTVIN
jgi:hypothetical protein